MESEVKGSIIVSRPDADPYAILRRTIRSRLSSMGIPNNMCWTDRNIVDAVRTKIGQPLVKPGDEWEGGYQVFRDNLISTIQEGGVEIAEPVTELPNIIKSLDNLLSSHLPPLN